MEPLKEIAELLIPVPEEDLKVLLYQYQAHLCALLQVPASLLYVADAMEPERFRYEAGAGIAQDPSPVEFRVGEGFLGQAVKEKHLLQQRLTGALFGSTALSALLRAEELNLFAIPLTYQGSVEGLWVLAGDSPGLLDTLQSPEWQELLYKTATYLQSIRARRSIQALLEQSQLQNQELIAREEELRQNLEELSATQEEMRRTQKLLEERAHWQTVLNDLAGLFIQNIASRPVFQSLSRIFVAQLAKHLEARALALVHWEGEKWQTLVSWVSKKSPIALPETWTLPPDLIQILSRQNKEIVVPASEIGLSGERVDCIVSPWLTPKRLEGLLLVIDSKATVVSPETRSRFLYDITGAFFSSYERVEKLSSYLRELLQEVAQVSRAQVSSVSRALAEKGELPWLDSIPILHRPAYVESLQSALRENKDRWIPPEELASRELVVMLGDSLLHLKWP